MWLPKFLYESIPFWYLVIGTALLGTAFFIDGAYWPEICAGAGLAALIAGLVLILRRKGYRSSRSRIDFDGTN